MAALASLTVLRGFGRIRTVLTGNKRNGTLLDEEDALLDD
jgi:hypothetical protein